MTLAGKQLVIKFSGEALGRRDHGLWEEEYLEHVCGEIASLYPETGRAIGALPHVAILLGGGNIVRGAHLKLKVGMQDGAVADEIGMRATILNCMILQERLENLHGIDTRLMTAWEDRGAGEPYIRRRALRHMEKGRLVILAGGTGKPDCSTDRALTQYGAEFGADLLLKASKMDGIFTSDPHASFRELQADPPVHLPYLTYEEFLAEPERFKQVLDRGAVTQAEAHGMVIRVFNARKKGALIGVLYEHDGLQFTDVGPAGDKFRPRMTFKGLKARYVGVGTDEPDEPESMCFEGCEPLPDRARPFRTGSRPVAIGDPYDPQAKDPDVFTIPEDESD